MPKKQKRNKRGAVSIGFRNGMLRLRWRHQGQPCDLSMHLPNTPLNMQAARAKAAEIERDIALGLFDCTLEKYKPAKITEPIAPPTTLELWDKFIQHRLSDPNRPPSSQAISSRYKPIASNLKRFNKDIDSDFTALEFITMLRSRQSPRIANQNLSLLRGFGEWTVKQKHWESNHFTPIGPLKASRPKGDKPFTLDEIHGLQDATRLDPVLLKYRDFILFLLSSGCRPSEAIGLRWEHIDLTRNEMYICESLSRGNHGARIRKGTKTDTGDRVLNIPSSIRTMLEGRSQGKEVTGLVFISPTGRPIDDHNFSQRIWKRLCETAGVMHRRPYNCRHSVASHAIQQGATLPDVAYLLGHTNTRMVAQVYGKSIDRPNLPEF